MIFCSKEECPARRMVEAKYPGAAKICIVDGGWMVFEFMSDYETWRKQK